jgi:hypothetical protein
MKSKPCKTETYLTELLIHPDGRILAHNLTPALARVLAALNPRDPAMRRRASVPGGTGGSPVPSGDAPGGTETTMGCKRGGRVVMPPPPIPVGEPPTGAGGSPAPPIFQAPCGKI